MGQVDDQIIISGSALKKYLKLAKAFLTVDVVLFVISSLLLLIATNSNSTSIGPMLFTGGALFIISFLAFSAGIIFWIIAYKFLKKSDIKSIDGVLPDFRRIKQLFYISLFLTVINTLALMVDAFMAAWS